MWLADERVIAVKITDETGHAEFVLRSQPLDFGEPIRPTVERLFDTLEVVGYSHGDDRATVIAGAKVGFEALALPWDPSGQGVVLQ
jgi:hypothetical protein